MGIFCASIFVTNAETNFLAGSLSGGMLERREEAKPHVCEQRASGREADSEKRLETDETKDEVSSGIEFQKDEETEERAKLTIVAAIGNLRRIREMSEEETASKNVAALILLRTGRQQRSENSQTEGTERAGVTQSLTKAFIASGTSNESPKEE